MKSEYVEEKLIDIETLRLLARDAVHKHMGVTAVVIAEEIARLCQSNVSDQLFLASCHFGNGEYRRCLALLEQRNLLSAATLSGLGALLRPDSDDPKENKFINVNIDDRPDPPSMNTLRPFSQSPGLATHRESIDAVQLAARALVALGQYEDCLLLVEAVVAVEEGTLASIAVLQCRRLLGKSSIQTSARPIEDKSAGQVHGQAASSSSCIGNDNDNGNGRTKPSSTGINPMSGVYCLAARCYDQLDNRDCSRRCLSAAVCIDPACVEALDSLVNQGLLSSEQRKELFNGIDFTGIERLWIKEHYRCMLRQSKDGPDGPTHTLNDASGSGGHGQSPTTDSPIAVAPPVSLGLTSLPVHAEGHPEGTAATNILGYSGSMSISGLLRAAEHMLFEQSAHVNEAYRSARLAYTRDPFHPRSVLVYIACLVELSLSAELFYLGHELTQLHPKQAMSWYAVGCYYWTCHKLEQAHKYLVKSTQLDKRFVQAYLMLGHVLAAQEEREHAVSAFRTACRLLPGDHRPVVLMAKELVKTGSVSLALHLLWTALESAPHDPVLLNELGVAFLLINRVSDAMAYLAQAVACLRNNRSEGSRASGAEIYSNYATALRLNRDLERAVDWYKLSLAEEPRDADTLAALGLTLHLLRRFDEAITTYHRALALHPTSAFCGEMLGRALEDCCRYSDAGLTRTEPARNHSHTDSDVLLEGDSGEEVSDRLEMEDSMEHSDAAPV